MAENVDLRKMIKSFRLIELNNLLSFAGKVKTGPKVLLQERAFQLLQAPSEPITQKIISLYNDLKLENRYSLSARADNGTGTGNRVNSLESANSNANADDMPPQGPINANVLLPTGQSTNPSHPVQHPTQTLHERIQCTVKFVEIPFFEVLEEIIKPTVLRHTYEHSLALQFNNQHMMDIIKSKKMLNNNKFVQLRFCQLNKTANWDQFFPSQTVVKVNEKLVPLPPTGPNKQAKCPLVPLDITDYLTLCTVAKNSITINWIPSPISYAVRVALVRKVHIDELIIRLCTKASLMYDHTKALISKVWNTDGNGEVATTSVTLSLKCPLTRTRLQYPCRTYNCLHPQCFDASSYLKMNELKGKWICPICSQPAQFNDLVIDTCFKDILDSPQSKTTDEVIIDGFLFWTVPTKGNGNGPSGGDDVITIIEDNEITTQMSLPTNMINIRTTTATIDACAHPVIDLTNSDSEDSQPLAAKRGRFSL